jgi:hypothetical protein
MLRLELVAAFLRKQQMRAQDHYVQVKPSIFIWIVQVMIEKENNFAQPGARYRSWAPDRYSMKLFLSKNAFLLCPITSLRSGLDVFEVRYQGVCFCFMCIVEIYH